MEKYTCASFFAGVGGIDLAFKNAGFETIYANEINPYAIETYELNHDIKVDARDICDVPVEEIPDFNILLAGFPCQPFSVAGNRQGFEDEKGRGNLFFELMRIIKGKTPEIIFLENVKGLVGHDNGNTFATILNYLQSENYFVKFQVLNTKSFGNLPQNRERIYIVAFKDEDIYNKFEFPKIIKRVRTLHSVIDFDKRVNDKYYYTDENFKYYDILVDGVVSNQTVYQWRRKYVRENKSNLCPTLTNNMGTGGHNVPIILAKHGIRKLTPRECFNLQGFPRDFKFPKYMSDMHLYGQAGNSVSVTVIERIAKNIRNIFKQKV
jgi:DNA (cytosine-5)-methyltransferase 1